MSDIDRETRKAKRYELGVHCSQLCLGGRASLIETTDPDPFNEDVVMATDYDDLLTRYDSAIAAVRAQAASAKPGRDLPKVRNALGLLRSLLTRYASQIDYAKERMSIASAALAELDASAQPWRDLPNVRAYLNKRRIDNGEDMVSPGFEASINKDVRMLRAALAELDAVEGK